MTCIVILRHTTVLVMSNYFYKYAKSMGAVLYTQSGLQFPRAAAEGHTWREPAERRKRTDKLKRIDVKYILVSF